MTASNRWISAADIARFAGVKPAAVSNWRRRHPDFPEAERRGSHEVFPIATVAAWLDGRKVAGNDRTPDEEIGATYGTRFRRSTGSAESVDSPGAAQNLTSVEYLKRAGPLVPPGSPESDATANKIAKRLWRALREYGTSRGLGPIELVALGFSVLQLRLRTAKQWSDFTDAVSHGQPFEVGSLLERTTRLDGTVAGLAHHMLPMINSPADAHQLAGIVDLLDRVDPATWKTSTAGGETAAPIAGQVASSLLTELAVTEGRRLGHAQTPNSLIRLATRLTAPAEGEWIHDPICRTGEFLVGAASYVRALGHDPAKLTLTGNEANQTLWWVARTNLLLHGLDADGLRFGTPLPPGRYDLVMTNPPFNMKNWNDYDSTPDYGWRYGPPPEHNANFAWLQHVLTSLTDDGRAAVVMPNIAAFSTNSRERAIRAAMVEDGAVEAIVALPPGLFHSTGIPVSLWLLKNPSKRDDDSVLLVDASAAGALANKTYRELPESDVDLIVDVCQARRTVTSGTVLAWVGTAREIREVDYVLHPGRYVTATTPVIDVHRTLRAVDRLRHESGESYENSRYLRRRADDQLARVGALVDGESMEWRRMCLGDVCDVTAGPSGATRLEFVAADGIPLIRPKDIRENRIVAHDVDQITSATAEQLARYRLRPGDIVFTRSGGLGQRALATEDHLDWLIGTACLRIRPRSGVSSGYLFYYLAHPGSLTWLTRNASGTAVMSLTTSTVQNMPLLVPSEPVQEAIVEILSAVDDEIAIHDQIRRSDAAIRDSLLPLLLRDPLV